MKKLLIIIFIFSMGITVRGDAQNPIIQTKYTADPAPMVYKDTVFLYTSHDEDDATGFKMKNWLLYTSTDMVNWTDHGIVASLENFSWVEQDNGAWAPQVIERNGKFYLYCPIHGEGIGVLVANTPYGPFKDTLGKRLIESDHIWDDIDPTVYIDDDGQAYLYWGNPDLYYVKLNDDMISYSGKIHKISSKPKNYQEGPWLYKRKDHYYLAYASTCCPEGIGYAMSDRPAGPWKYKGMIINPNPKSSGNHPGIIDYKGNSYIFSFDYSINYSLTNVHRERRSVVVSKLKYNPDGTIQRITSWPEKGVSQIGTLNPYTRTEAETIAWESGIKTEKGKNGRLYVTNVDNGDYIKVKGVDFGALGAKAFHASVASDLNEGMIELYIDRLQGTKIGSLSISNTGDEKKWKLKRTNVRKTPGVHDLFLVFKGNFDGKMFKIDYWRFDKSTK